MIWLAAAAFFSARPDWKGVARAVLGSGRTPCDPGQPGLRRVPKALADRIHEVLVESLPITA